VTSLLEQLGLGRGIYTVAEAEALTGVSRARIRRWFAAAEERERVVCGDYDIGETGELQLSFLDLTETRFVDAFLRFGVPWNELRAAARNAAELLDTSHPFSTMKFRTDGRRIFADVTEESGDSHLLQLRDKQHVFRRVIEPSLRGLEFGDEFVRRWWPLGQNRRIVIDPQRTFGTPIGVGSGVPALLLAKFANANSVVQASSWYEVDAREVRDAVDFARRFAA
jgi:uncharacterized protein (DUF433 family)